MPACDLRVSPDVALLGTGVGSTGNVSFTLPVPNAPSLVGAEFWQLAFVLAPGANAAGLLASNSMHGAIGRSR